MDAQNRLLSGAAASIVILTILRRQRKKRRARKVRQWVRDWIQRRDLFLVDWKAPEQLQNVECQHPSCQTQQPEAVQRIELKSPLFQNANLVAGAKPWFYPDGCSMFDYTIRETRRCMKEAALKNGPNHFIFAGDSKMRKLFDSFNSHVGKYPRNTNAHSSQQINDTSNDMAFISEFLWTPFLYEGVTLFANIHKRITREKPKFVTHEAGLWDIKHWNGSQQGYDLFKGNLTLLVPSIKLITEKVPYLWMSLDPTVYGRLDKTRLMLTNENVNKYNDLIAEKINGSGGTMWYSSRQVAQALSSNGYADGYHLAPSSVRYKAQILLNWLCNKYNVQQSTKTLCFVENHQPKNATPPTHQLITSTIDEKIRDDKTRFVSDGLNRLRVASFVIVILVVFTVSLYTQSSENGVVGESRNNVSRFLTFCNMIIMLAYISIISNSGYSVHHPYNGSVMLILSVLLFVIVTIACTEKTSDDQILNRRQTDEWKGLLSIIFIIASIAQDNQPSTGSPLTCLIVSSYLFITGFGHFTYFWTTGDFSCRRVFKTLVRLNLSVILVCLVSHTSYLAHRIIPLVTAWFLSIYITMACWPRHNLTDGENSEKRCFIIMTVKLFVLFIVTTFVSFFQNYFVNLLDIVGVSISNERANWRYDWALHRYSVLSGMTFGLLYQYSRGELPNTLNSVPTKTSNVKTILMALLCIPGLITGVVLSYTCIVYENCSLIYPATSFLPVISYVGIRNLTTVFRSRYNYVFAWFGQMSLELFIAYFHIWTSRDSPYVLDLLPGYPVLNMATTIAIFISVCFYLRDTTLAITSLLEQRKRHVDSSVL